MELEKEEGGIEVRVPGELRVQRMKVVMEKADERIEVVVVAGIVMKAFGEKCQGRLL